MSTRRKRAGKRQPAGPKKNPSKPRAPAAPPRRISPTLTGTQEAREECIGAICLVEVTLHSLEWQDIASPEQEVLMRALKAIWVVHGWIDDLPFKDLEGEGSDREGES